MVTRIFGIVVEAAETLSTLYDLELKKWTSTVNILQPHL